MNDNIQPFIFAFFFAGGFFLATIGTPLHTFGWHAFMALTGFAVGSFILHASKN